MIHEAWICKYLSNFTIRVPRSRSRTLVFQIRGHSWKIWGQVLFLFLPADLRGAPSDRAVTFAVFPCVSLRTRRRSNTKLSVSVCHGSLKCSWTTEELRHREASVIKHCYWLGSIFSIRTWLTWASGTKLLFHKRTQTHTRWWRWCLWWRWRQWNQEIKRCSHFDLPVFLFWCFFFFLNAQQRMWKKYKNATFDVWSRTSAARQKLLGMTTTVGTFTFVWAWRCSKQQTPFQNEHLYYCCHYNPDSMKVGTLCKM